MVLLSILPVEILDHLRFAQDIHREEKAIQNHACMKKPVSKVIHINRRNVR